MKDRFFLDSNILIYCYTSTEPDKQTKAKAVANLPKVLISTQVLKEFVNTLSKKFKLDWSIIQLTIDELEGNFAVHINTASTIKKACLIAERYRFSFYDSLIIAAALESDCAILYSEDMQHEQIIDDTLTIINPFR